MCGGENCMKNVLEIVEFIYIGEGQGHYSGRFPFRVANMNIVYQGTKGTM